MSLHHLAVMTQLSVIPILSPVCFMHVGDPYIPPFKNFYTLRAYVVSVYLENSGACRFYIVHVDI